MITAGFDEKVIFYQSIFISFFTQHDEKFTYCWRIF